MGKKEKKRYSREFKRRVVKRMEQCDNIRELARELGVERRLLYYWRKLELEERDEERPLNSRETRLRKEVNELKRVLAEKTMEVDFFKGALQKVAARRQQRGVTGGPASTTKSGK